MNLKPCCPGCTADRPEHVVTDYAGREWRFEMHPFCGPSVLAKDGSIKTRQPGSRSSFWPAFEAWQKERAR